MILSHKYKFIFVKPAKVAGTSLELALRPLLGPDDVATPVVWYRHGLIMTSAPRPVRRTHCRRLPTARTVAFRLIHMTTGRSGISSPPAPSPAGKCRAISRLTAAMPAKAA